MGWVPERGEVVWVFLDSQLGHEQAGRRLAVVLSPAAYNAKVGLAVLCPVTSQAKGYPFEVPLPDGLPVSGVVLSDQGKSFDWRARRAQLICKLPPEATTAVLNKLGALLRP